MSALSQQVLSNTGLIQALIDASKNIDELQEIPNDIADADSFVIRSGGITYKVTKLVFFQAIRDYINLTIFIEGNPFTYRPLPSNSTGSFVAGDIACNGWIDQTTFGLILVYVAGDPLLIASWNINSEI
jgi:hypothetical protein